MDIDAKIKGYWERIDKIETKISELAHKGIDYSAEMRKRRTLLTNVKSLQKIKEKTS